MITLDKIQLKIAEAINKSGMTRTEIAHRLNVNPATVSHYVKGDKMPALDTFAKLCAVLDLDANDMLCVAEYENE